MYSKIESAVKHLLIFFQQAVKVLPRSPIALLNLAEPVLFIFAGEIFENFSVVFFSISFSSELKLFSCISQYSKTYVRRQGNFEKMSAFMQKSKRRTVYPSLALYFV